MRKKFSLIILIISVVIFVGCGSNKSIMNSAESSSGLMKPTPEIAEDNAGLNLTSTEDIAEEGNTYNSIDVKKIINRADLTVETIEFDSAISSLEALISKLEGYIQSSNIFQQGINKGSYNENRNGQFVVRIPKEKFQEFLSSSSKFGVITNKIVYGEDISTEYYDREARLKVLKAQEERYLEILKEAKDIKEVLEVEKYLTDVRYEIESITANLKQMDNLVEYSTVNINIFEVTEVSEGQKVPKTLGEKIIKTFLDSIDSLKVVGSGIVLAIIAIIPYVSIIAIIGGVVFYIVRAIRRKGKNKKE